MATVHGAAGWLTYTHRVMHPHTIPNAVTMGPAWQVLERVRIQLGQCLPMAPHIGVVKIGWAMQKTKSIATSLGGHVVPCPVLSVFATQSRDAC